ncbi:hypothetical protein BDR04DRAFT_373865 [Suillus decipiens]|nr:hypothetical protein BDR04DRAFT_373865 [Suillus decipiens]
MSAPLSAPCTCGGCCHHLTVSSTQSSMFFVSQIVMLISCANYIHTLLCVFLRNVCDVSILPDNSLLSFAIGIFSLDAPIFVKLLILVWRCPAADSSQSRAFLAS